LSRHPLLLVVDNFEQVVESATAVARLLERSPRTSVLITSRRPLGVYGERELAVAPLTAPPDEIKTVDRAADYDTVQLFVQAAQAVVGRASDPMLDAIQALLDNGLIHVDDTEGGSRYRMLETVREYARERLTQSGEADAVRARHADYYVHPAARSGRASRVAP